MARGESDSPGARALREAGFVKLPSFWVPIAMRDEVIRQAERYLNQIKWIRNQAENTHDHSIYP